MAGDRSLGSASVKVLANAEQFVAEFKRANQAAKDAGTSISAQVDKISNTIEKHFTGGYLARSLLTGLGIGTGFALAQKAAELIAKYWQDAADSAKKVEASSAAQLASTMATIKMSQSLPEQLATLQKQQGGLYAELGSVPWGSSWLNDILGIYGLTSEDTTNQIVERRGAIMAELQKTALEIGQVQKEIAAKNKATNEELSNSDEETLKAFSRMTARTILPRDAYDALQANIVAANSERAAATTPEEKIKANKDMTASFEAMRPVLGALYQDSQGWIKESETGTQRYDDALKNINKDEKVGGLTAAQAAAARVKAWETLDPVGKEMTKIWENFSDASASAFADMVTEGRTSFSDLVKIVERGVLEMAAKLLLIDPIINSMFHQNLPTDTWGDVLGGIMGLGMAAGAASGGRITGPTLVGEAGPEIFVPDSAGTVIPNSALTSGATNGDTYFIDARGADEARLSQLERTLVALNASVERRSVAAVVAAKRRPGTIARMLV